MKKFKKILNRISALVLIATLITSSLSGCGRTGVETSAETMTTPISTTEIAEAITQEIILEAESSTAAAETFSPAIEEHIVPLENRISDDWHDYIGDLDAFVYGALVSEYQLAYKTFNAVITLPDDSEIYGIGYTDYSSYFEREDGEGGYFPAGFLALIGEPEIPEGLSVSGIEIINLDNPDSEYQFVYAYDTEPFLEHCVIWNQYLRYGIDDNQHITYMTQDYERGKCDEELGSLYSYDERRVVFESNPGNYQDVNGESLYGSIDYAEIQEEVNRILEEQDFNFSDVDVETTLYQAKDAMRSYLLSLQKETFMGCNVEELLAISETLDPKECVQMTPDGMVLVDMTSAPPKEPEALTKWLTGICCGTAIVACVAVSVFVPALVPVTASISGAVVEVFMEVIVQNHEMKNVNWGKVAIAAATGAVLAWGCPMLAGHATSGIVSLLGKNVSAEMATQLGKIAGYGILTFSNAVVTGSSGAAFAVLDGVSKEEALDAFLLGAALGAACTGAATLVAKSASAGMNVLKEARPNNWLLKITKKASVVSEFIGKHQVKLFDGKLDSVLIPKSINEAAEAAGYQLKLQQTDNVQLIKRVDQLPSESNKNFVMKDDSGNTLTKADLRSNGGNGKIELRDTCDPEIKEIFAEYNVSEITIKDGVPDFSPVSEYNIDIEITPNRTDNFARTYTKLANDWSENPSSIPAEFQEEMSRRGIEAYDLNDTIVEDILLDLKWTIHEDIDNTIYLVPRAIHSKIGHTGGVAYAAATEAIQIGTVFFNELHDSVATGITGTLIIEGAQKLR